jgi:hypothetical protein
VLSSAAILAVALAFVAKYVFHYYLNYNEAAFTIASPVYWTHRGWLLMHITGGTLAVLSGPFQFWTGFRTRYAGVHRMTGKVFLAGVAVGSVGALAMAVTTAFGWAWAASSRSRSRGSRRPAWRTTQF